MNVVTLIVSDLVTAHIRRMGKVIFSQASVRPHPRGGGGTPIWTTGRGIPHSQVRMWGYPGYPRGWGTPCQDSMGVPLPLLGLDGIPPIETKWAPPPPVRGRSGDKAAMRRAVYLLHSCSRTFLFYFKFS